MRSRSFTRIGRPGWSSAGAVAGITSVLLVMLMSQPRIFFSMSRDGLLPAGVSKVHPRFRTPVHHDHHHVLIVALVAGFVPIQILGEMTSIGTLFAFVIVSRRGAGAAREAAGRGAAVQGAVAGRSFRCLASLVVRRPDGQPLGDDLGAVPGAGWTSAC